MSTPTSPSSAPAPKPLSLGVIFLTLYIDLIGFSIFFPVGPAMLEWYVNKESEGGLLSALVRHLQALASAAHASDLATGALFAGALGSVYSLMQFLFSPVWGARSDRHGRRPILLLTIAGNALSYLLLFFSGSFLLFFAGRILGGIMGGNIAVAIAAVSDVTTRENRAKGMGIVGVAFGLGFLTGPVIGGLTAPFNLLERWPGLAALGVHPFSVPAAIAFTLCLINLVWIKARFRETLPPAARGTGTTTLRDRNPLHSLFRQPDGAIRRVNLVGFVVTFGFSFFESVISFFTADALHYSPRDLTLIFVNIGVVSILTQGVLARRLVPRLGEKPSAVLGMALIGVGFAGLGYAIGIARSVPLMYLMLTISTIGSGFANIALSSLVSLYAGPEEQGKVLGIYRSLGFLARALSPAVAGWLFFNSGGTVTFVIASLVLLTAAALGTGLPRPAK
ncbi:Tetracycline resistance protein, class C [Lacunisphaera limnophila]|uniref:Tetracycline resistance protein, class C n=1 Tax=Lacunisphaera limnophila TaxID=1838286 RepID=A0A1D8AVH5_9BACT|nr:MFS transporter [Lacunisphaera limnophila]AOS44904.1 Tetracycline resistance protein, class C [Lacunisphaera limnophila]